MKLSWAQKELHGRYPRELSNQYVDQKASHSWLTRGDLFGETEGFMVAIQDEVINTKNYRKHIIKDTTIKDTKCRQCHSTEETIQHITSGCKMLAQTDYLHRHNQVSNIIHQQLALQHKLIDTHTPYYKYQPQTILESQTHKLYYDRTIITDKTIHFNRPDITLINKHKKTAYLIDIAIPNTNNLQKTHSTKIQKYTELAQETRKLWGMDRVVIIPIILSCTGVIPRTLHNSIHALGLPRNTYIALQKATILNTCHTVRKFLNTNTLPSSDEG